MTLYSTVIENKSQLLAGKKATGGFYSNNKGFRRQTKIAQIFSHIKITLIMLSFCP